MTWMADEPMGNIIESIWAEGRECRTQENIEEKQWIQPDQNISEARKPETILKTNEFIQTADFWLIFSEGLAFCLEIKAFKKFFSEAIVYALLVEWLYLAIWHILWSVSWKDKAYQRNHDENIIIKTTENNIRRVCLILWVFSIQI